MNVTDLQAELLVSKALLAALGAAIIALADPTVKSYTLDSGQTTETVSRNTLPELMEQRRSLMNEICTMEARLSGSGSITVLPGW